MVTRIGIVVPTYKKELWDKFVKAWDWNSKLYELTLYIIEDNPDPSILLYPKINFIHYCWNGINQDLKEDSWIIPRRCSAIRSYGYLKAYQDGNDYILTLDDDCYPVKKGGSIEGLIYQHLAPINGNVSFEYSSFFNVGKFLFNQPDFWMRGSPIRYRKPRKPVMSIGGWNNNPDLDAWTQLEYQSPMLKVSTSNCVNVPKNLGVTMCGMNLLFSREVIPIAYFLLQGKEWNLDRVDDIWAGLFMKKVLDYFDKPMCINGFATVNHERASNVFNSLKAEGVSLLENELLWYRILPLQLEGDTMIRVYESLINQLDEKWFPHVEDKYGLKLKEAMLKWINLFQQ